MAGEGGGGALRQLIAEFGISVDAESLKGFGEKIDGAKEKLKNFAEIIGAGFLGERMKEFVQGQIESGAALKRTSEILGTSVEDLQRFQLAAQESGASAEEASTGLRFLSRNIGEAIAGGGEAAAVFSKLGVHLKDAQGEALPVTEVAAQLADGFQKLGSQGERTASAMKLFGRGGATMIPMLQQGSAAMRGMLGDADALGGGLSEAFVEKAHEAERAQVRMNFALGGFKSLVAAEFIPAVVAITEKVTGWIAGAIQLAKETHGLRTAFIALNIGGAVMMFSKLAGVLKVAELGFAGAARALLGFAWPILLVGGLYLIFDDLFTMMTGGKSVIGALLDKYEGVGTAAAVTAELKDTWAELTELWAEAGPLLKSGFVSALQSAFDIVKGTTELIFAAVNEVGGMAKYAAGDHEGGEKMMARGDVWNTKGLATIGQAFKNEDPAQGAAGRTPRTATEMVGRYQHTFEAPPVIRHPTSATRQTIGAGGAVQQTNKIDVRVQTGSGDPKVIGSVVSDGLMDAMRKSVQLDRQRTTAAMGA